MDRSSGHNLIAVLVHVPGTPATRCEGDDPTDSWRGVSLGTPARRSRISLWDVKLSWRCRQTALDARQSAKSSVRLPNYQRAHDLKSAEAPRQGKPPRGASLGRRYPP